MLSLLPSTRRTATDHAVQVRKRKGGLNSVVRHHSDGAGVPGSSFQLGRESAPPQHGSSRKGRRLAQEHTSTRLAETRELGELRKGKATGTQVHTLPPLLGKGTGRLLGNNMQHFLRRVLLSEQSKMQNGVRFCILTKIRLSLD